MLIVLAVLLTLVALVGNYRIRKLEREVVSLRFAEKQFDDAIQQLQWKVFKI